MNALQDRSLDDLREVAQGLVAGTIFCDRQVPDARMLPVVFMALGFLTEPAPENLGMVYEHMHKAAPRGVNGMPCFFSCQMLSQGDTEKVLAMVAKLNEAARTVTP